MCGITFPWPANSPGLTSSLSIAEKILEILHSDEIPAYSVGDFAPK